MKTVLLFLFIMSADMHSLRFHLLQYNCRGFPLIILKELSSEDFVILNQGTLLHQLFLSLCASCGFQPNIVLECKHMDSIFDLVSQHMGISLLTDRHFDASVRTSAAGQHLKLIPLAPALYSQTYLCYLKNTILNATAIAMLEYMKEYIKSV